MAYYGQGGPFEPDPYIPASQILTGTNDSYVILRIDLASIRKGLVTLDGAQAANSNGDVIARLLSKQDFQNVLLRQTADEQLLNQLDIKVERTYFPDGGARVSPGTLSYAVVLLGKGKFPTPLTVKAQVSVDGTPRTFELQWTN